MDIRRTDLGDGLYVEQLVCDCGEYLIALDDYKARPNAKHYKHSCKNGHEFMMAGNHYPKVRHRDEYK